MGITVSYRGRIADFDRIEDFEDRVLDLVLDLGGTAQIWRSSADHDPKRMVRGVLAHIDPGQETTSLLIAPEVWLVNLFEIEDAERGVHKEISRVRDESAARATHARCRRNPPTTVGPPAENSRSRFAGRGSFGQRRRGSPDRWPPPCRSRRP
jgi:hypothetical protein